MQYTTIQRSTKELVRTLLLILMCSAPFVQGAPNAVHYQGKLLDNGGVPLNETVSIDVGLYTAESGGAAVWTESHALVPVSNGTFSIVLGSIDPVSNPLDAATVNVAQAWLEVTVNGEVLSPRQSIAASPYALRAQNAAQADNALSVEGANRATLAQEALVMVQNSGGAGSNLDADRLDGKESTDFVSASGGSITGDLSVSSQVNATQVNVNGTYQIGGVDFLSDGGTSNTYVGGRAGEPNPGSGVETLGSVAVGYYSGWRAHGLYNVMLGLEAGAFSEGEKNTYIGTGAGSQISAPGTGGSYNVFLGYGAGYNKQVSNKLYIENSDSSTPLIYGDFAIDEVVIHGDLEVTKDLEVSEDLVVTGDLTVGEVLSVDEDLRVAGDLEVTGDIIGTPIAGRWESTGSTSSTATGYMSWNQTHLETSPSELAASPNGLAIDINKKGIYSVSLMAIKRDVSTGEDAQLEIWLNDGPSFKRVARLYGRGDGGWAGLSGSVVVEVTSDSYHYISVFDPNNTNGVYASPNDYNILSIHRL